MARRLPMLTAFFAGACVMALAAADNTEYTYRADLTVLMDGYHPRVFNTLSYYSLFANVTNQRCALVYQFPEMQRRRRRRDALPEYGDGCGPLIRPPTMTNVTWCAIVNRGNCKFEVKAHNAAAAGAAGILVVDSEMSSRPPIMSASDIDNPDPLARTIPSVSITQQTGSALHDLMLEGNVTIWMHVAEKVNVNGDVISPSWLFGHVVIFAGAVVVVSLLVSAVYFLKSLREQRAERIEARAANAAIQNLPTPTYTGTKGEDGDVPVCAVCLDDYSTGDVLRKLPW